MNFLESIFSLLAANQQLPYYQAERRIDIFINFFLEEIVSQYTPFKDARYIAAEFPLRKDKKTAHAAHIDYLMVSEEQEKILFVELKTDDSSFDHKQIDLYLQHEYFEDWYKKFDSIEMKGFKEKKEALTKSINDKLQKAPEKYKIHVIVLKPMHKQADYWRLEPYSTRINFISLRHLIIKPEYQPEWELFKKEVLQKLPVSDMDRIIGIGQSGICTIEDLHYFLPDFPTPPHGSEYIFTNRWKYSVKNLPVLDLEHLAKGFHFIEMEYKKEKVHDFGFESPSKTIEVIKILEKMDIAKASALTRWVAETGGNYYIPASNEPGESKHQPSLFSS